MKLSTKISESLEDWNVDQYSTLLLLHAAYSDLDYSEEERAKIKEFVSEPTLIEIERYYQSRTDGQILQLILKYKSKFLPSVREQQQILQKINSIFEADGEITKLEQTQYEFLSRLIMDSQS